MKSRTFGGWLEGVTERGRRKKESRRKFYLNHKAEEDEYNRQWFADNVEKKREYDRKYNQKRRSQNDTE